jgi:hypothetical protein
MNGMSPPDCPAIHQKKSESTVMGNAGTSTNAQTGSGINPVKYKPDEIKHAPAPAQKIRAIVLFFILITPALLLRQPAKRSGVRKAST